MNVINTGGFPIFCKETISTLSVISLHFLAKYLMVKSEMLNFNFCLGIKFIQIMARLFKAAKYFIGYCVC